MRPALTWLFTGLAVMFVIGAAPVRDIAAAPYDQTAGELIAHTILMTEYAPGPAEIETQAGPVTLRLVNAGSRRRTLTVLIDGVESVSPEVRPGDTADWQITRPRPGRYQLWCNEYRHLENGMGAEIVAAGS